MPAVHDVAVVGFGPVGQMLALLLGRRGHDVVVLERRGEPYPLPRAVVYDSEVGRLLQSAGVADEVRAISQAADDAFEWRTAAGETLMRIDWSGTGPGGWPVQSFYAQPNLERVLSDAVADLDAVRVHRGATVTRLTQDDDGVDLTWTGEDAEEHATRARYVIGCDGSRSFVRDQLGIEMADLGFFYDWLVVDVLPHDDEVWSPMNWQLCDPARPTAVMSGGPGRRRWEFMRLPGETVEELSTPETAWKLLEPWNRNAQNTTLERHVVYTFQARWAKRWNDGRVLLAGDAAHQMPPFAGQGLCSGIRDTANLAWKLDLILSGRAPSSLLDSYTSERATHQERLINMSVGLGRALCVLDPQAAAGRDARMLAERTDPDAVMSPPPPAGLTDGIIHRTPDGGTGPLAGILGEQHPVRHDGREGLLDTFFDAPRPVLLTDGITADGLSDRTRDVLSTWGVRVVALNATDPADGYEDVTGAYLDRLRADGLAAMLVRPDFYVFGGAPADGIEALLADFDHRLTES